MSWEDYLNNGLINRENIYGHVYENVLNEAGIFNLSGNVIVKTPGLNISNTEMDELIKLFECDPKMNSQMFVNLGGKKLQIVIYDGDFAFLVGGGAGATVAKTNKTFIIGTFCNSKTYIKDGKKLSQNDVECKLIVEEFAKYLKSIDW